MRKNNFIPRGRNRRVGSVLQIFCEGETEESYLNAYKRFMKYSHCEIVHSHHTDPKGLVEEAIEAKRNAPSADKFWVAYDLEDVSIGNRLKAHEDAFRLAQTNGVHIALSAISIEIWFLLHFTQTPKTYHNCNGAVRALKKYIPNYLKGDSRVFFAIQQFISNARKNASLLQKRQERNNPGKKPYEKNPYTTFHLLLDDIERINEFDYSK